MTAKLVGEEGLLKDLLLSFDEGNQWIIGRDPDSCQLLVEDPAASRKHVLCRRTPQGIVVENLSTTNPTLVNDEEVTQPRLLTNDDLVKIGDTIFRFYADAEAQLLDQSQLTPTDQVVETPTTEEVPPEAAQNTLLEDEAKNNISQVNFDLLETGRWLLKVISGPNSGAEFSMQTGSSYVIGTDPNTCDIVFYDTSVSRQHARISITQEDELFIEDLKSRNSTRIDGEPITGKVPLPISTIISTGTTSFVVYDREGEMQTIISPLLPSIVKVLQKEPKEAAEAAKSEEEASAAKSTEEALKQPVGATPTATHALGTFIVTAIIIGLFVIIGFGLQSLFQQEPVVKKEVVDPVLALSEALKAFPSVKSSYNKTTGKLLLVGHVLTATDKSQLVYNLQGLNFIKDLDDSGVVIDEYVWGEANTVLSKNPEWKGVTVYSPEPGRFVLTGYLQTRAQAEQVWDYLTRNFPYLDLLENKIVVEEDIANTVVNALQNAGISNINVQMANGELLLSGSVTRGTKSKVDKLAEQFREIPGVRVVRDVVTERAPSEAVVNISDRYLVTGSSRVDGGKLNVLVNGRILTEGDILDGMKITTIQQNYILLEKGGTTYRIDYNR